MMLSRGENMKHLKRNFAFMLRNIKRTDRFYWVYILLEVVLNTAVVYFGLRLTETVVELATNPPAIDLLIRQISLAVLGLTILLILQVLIKNKLSFISQIFRMQSLIDYMSMNVDTDFQNLLDPKYQKLLNATSTTSNTDNSVTGAFISHVVAFSHNLLQLMLLGSTLLFIDVNFFIIIIILLMIMVLYRNYQAKVIEAMREDRQSFSKKTTYLIEESGNFKVAKDMRLYGVKDWFNDIFDQLLSGSTKILKKGTLVVVCGQIITGLLIAILTGYGYFVFVKSYMADTMTLAELSFYISALTALTAGTFAFVNSIFDLLQDSQEITPIVDFFNYPYVFNHEGKPFDFDAIHTIEFKDVSFRYADAKEATFENFNLRIEQSEKVAIVGLNGAGKSTLVKLLCNLIKPDNGEILINGINNQEFNLENYYEQFSVVFQEQFAMPISIRETIVQDQVFNERRYQEVLEQSGVGNFLAQFPLGDQTSLVQAMDAESFTLSGGQHQKLKLAQALYKNGKILILDEPTAALDPISESEVYSNYFKLSQDNISLFITHRLASTQFCDRILYIEEGKIIEDGTHDSLLKLKGKYFELFETQAFYYKEELSHE